MTTFKLHTIESAPEGSKEILEGALKQNGFIPNLYKIMAESPEILKAYQQMNQLFMETSLTAVEKNIVWLTVSFYNQCHYCTAIHSMVAKMFKLPDEMIEGLRNGQPLSDSKLQALRIFTGRLVEKRGWVSDEETREFLDSGYSQRNILELVVGIGQKTISNYVNHLVHTPLDKQIEGFKWEADTSV